MPLHELQYLPPVTLSASQTVYRVQRIKARPGAVTTGALKTAPIGDMSGRFALTGAATGYFAESPETAVYESLARREAVWLSISNAARRQLLCLRTTRDVQLLRAGLLCRVRRWPGQLQAGLAQGPGAGERLQWGDSGLPGAWSSGL